METKKIKILYCITKATWGGAQRYVFDLATSLPKNQYEVTVLMGGEGTLKDKLKLAEIKTIDLPGLERDIKISTDISLIFSLIKIFKKEKPQIVHLNSSKIGLLGAIAVYIFNLFNKKSKIKAIFTGHGWAFNEDRNWFQKKVIHSLHWFTIALCTQTIAVSQATADQISTSSFLKGKITVIKNGINKTDFLDKEVARQKILDLLPGNEINGNLWIGTISELHKNKGLKYIIEAMSLIKLNDSNPEQKLPILIIIGEGEKRLKLQQRIDRYKLNNVVFMPGRIDNASQYLKAFDIFTLTSTTEAFPYSILEAGQSGLPIIASAVGGIPEVINDMANGILLKPRDPEEIKKALEFLMANPHKMADFSHEIKIQISNEFSLKKMVDKTMALYK